MEEPLNELQIAAICIVVGGLTAYFGLRLNKAAAVVEWAGGPGKYTLTHYINNRK